MAHGKTFKGRVINIGSESFEHCIFDGCVLTCNSPIDFLRLRHCRFVATMFLGDGWPDYIKDEMNPAALEQMAAKETRQ